ncbi:MAG: hypothetical protein MJ009_00505 [Paludibacteraceae bacterium]|nr:hypothetical protein [Paludibacteraceae bacterium]
MTGLQFTRSDDGTGYDFLLDIKTEGGKITQGICLGETTPQNQAFILIAQKGDFKEHPTVGVGINDMAKDNNLSLWRRAIIDALVEDGQRVNSVKVTETSIHIDAEYQ